MKNLRYFVDALLILSVTQRVTSTNIKDVSEHHDTIEGDILVTPEVSQFHEELKNNKSMDDTLRSSDLQDSAQRNRRDIWISKIVPYELHPSISSVYKKTIEAAVAEYHAKTCIKFVKRSTEKTWVKFVRGSRCRSGIGKRSTPGYQKIFLAKGCNHKDIIMHELMHTLGFWHEISRPDRDQYVEIMWDNIGKSYRRNFFKQSHRAVDTLGVLYDYNSLLHYSNTAFSKNGRATIRSLQNPRQKLGQARTFSKLDLIKLNSLYDCKGAFGGWSSWSGFSPCNSACNKYRQRFCYSNNRARDCPLADKHGIETEITKCPHKECFAPINGHWSRWSEWSPCSTPCGYGTRNRTRTCSDPTPKNGGKPCVGRPYRTMACEEITRGPVYYRFMVYSARQNKCLSLRGQRVVVENCSNKTTRQTWGWSAYNQLVSVATGQCLDVDTGARSGTPVRLSKCCKEKLGQQWSCSGGMVRPEKTNLGMNFRNKGNVVELHHDTGPNSQWQIFGKKKSNICTMKPACKAKTEKKGCCVFPFTYRNVVYRSCAFSNSYSRFWCATSPNYPMDRRWGFCETQACKVKTTKGDCCVFPFKYHNKWFRSCTTYNFNNRRWCATTSNYNKDRKWGLCQSS